MAQFLSDQDLNNLKALLVRVYRSKSYSNVNNWGQAKTRRQQQKEMEAREEYHDNFRLLESIQLCSLDEGRYCWELSGSKDTHAYLASRLQQTNANYLQFKASNHSLESFDPDECHDRCDNASSQDDNSDGEWSDERDRQKKLIDLFYANIRPFSGMFRCIAADNKRNRVYILFDSDDNSSPRDAILEIEARYFDGITKTEDERKLLENIKDLMDYGNKLGGLKNRHNSAKLTRDHAFRLRVEYNKYLTLKYSRDLKEVQTYHEDITRQSLKFKNELIHAYNDFAEDHQPGVIHEIFQRLMQAFSWVFAISLDLNKELTIGETRPGFFNKTTRQEKIIEISNSWTMVCT